MKKQALLSFQDQSIFFPQLQPNIYQPSFQLKDKLNQYQENIYNNKNI